MISAAPPTPSLTTDPVPTTRHPHPAEELSKPFKSLSQEVGPCLRNCPPTEILLVPSPGDWEKDGADKPPLVAHQFLWLEKGLSVAGPTISEILYQPGLQTGPQVLPPPPQLGPLARPGHLLQLAGPQAFRRSLYIHHSQSLLGVLPECPSQGPRGETLAGSTHTSP